MQVLTVNRKIQIFFFFPLSQVCVFRSPVDLTVSVDLTVTIYTSMKLQPRGSVTWGKSWICLSQAHCFQEAEMFVFCQWHENQTSDFTLARG